MGAETQEPPMKILVSPDPSHHLARSAIKDARASCGSGKFQLGSSTNTQSIASHPESLPTISAGGQGWERKAQSKRRSLTCRVVGWGRGPGAGFESLFCQCPHFFVPSFLFCPVRLRTGPTPVVARVNLDSVWGTRTLLTASSTGVSCHLSTARSEGPALTFTFVCGNG